MKWATDGDLQPTIVRDFEIAVAGKEAIALRGFAEVQEQLAGEMAPSSRQLVTTRATARPWAPCCWTRREKQDRHRDKLNDKGPLSEEGRPDGGA